MTCHVNFEPPYTVSSGIPTAADSYLARKALKGPLHLKLTPEPLMFADSIFTSLGQWKERDIGYVRFRQRTEQINKA